jgi:mannose-6-phosphate isomerase-like protein (cupin superfamily)
MRTFEVKLAIAALAAASLPAQQSGPAIPMKDFASSADVAALIAQAKSEHKEGQPLLSKPILTLAPINANLEYRTAVAPAAVHETEAEIFYVIDGSGTMVTGGQLTAEKRINAENLTGTGIQNGQSRRVAKGDFTIVPQGVPHWFSKIDGTLVLMSLHVPRKSGSASVP